MTKINDFFFFRLWMTNIIYSNIPISLINCLNGRVYFSNNTYIFLCTYALNAIKVIELYMEHTKKKRELYMEKQK